MFSGNLFSSNLFWFSSILTVGISNLPFKNQNGPEYVDK
jgi:hypothetical protein